MQIAGVELTRKRIVWLVGLALACAAFGLASHYIDVAALHKRAEQLNGPTVFFFLVVLPLFGFPATVLHVIVGARFGPVLGAGLVAIAILLQLLISYALVKAVPHFFRDRLEPLRKQLPTRAAHRSVTLFAVLLPGVPYFMVNYVLPLIGVPLGTYILYSLPIHVARSLIAIMLGDASEHMTPTRIAIIVVYWIVIMGACWLSWRNLKKQLGDQPKGAGGRKRRG